MDVCNGVVDKFFRSRLHAKVLESSRAGSHGLGEGAKLREGGLRGGCRIVVCGHEDWKLLACDMMLTPLCTHGHDFSTCKAVAGCARGFRAKEPALERWLRCGLGVVEEEIPGDAVGGEKNWRNETFGRVNCGWH